MNLSSTRLFAGVFPEFVRVAEMQVALADPSMLFAEELAQIANAVVKRRLEYAAVRQLARPLIEACGVMPGPLVNGPDRAPRWPEGVAGCMSHSAGYAVAAVAASADAQALGCDIEPCAALPSAVVDEILLPPERLRVHAGEPWIGRLIFSAKETVYKAQYRFTRAYWGFDAVEIIPNLEDRSFEARVHQASPVFPVGFRFRGRFNLLDGRLATGLALDKVGGSF